MRFARAVLLPGLGAVVLAWITFRVSVFYLIQPVACPPDANFQSSIGDVVVDSMCTVVSANTPMYFAWLATLPFAGALAAALARRAGARPAERLAAALFPALALAVEGTVFGAMSGFLWRIPVYWVLAPAIICALGALPFLGGRENAGPRQMSAAQT